MRRETASSNLRHHVGVSYGAEVFSTVGLCLLLEKIIFKFIINNNLSGRVEFTSLVYELCRRTCMCGGGNRPCRHIRLRPALQAIGSALIVGSCLLVVKASASVEGGGFDVACKQA